eukprot:1772684-Alexandrium_andersonii.AAC.1
MDGPPCVLRPDFWPLACGAFQVQVWGGALSPLGTQEGSGRFYRRREAFELTPWRGARACASESISNAL